MKAIAQTARPAEERLPAYRGIRATVDGSAAAVWVERHVSQGACAYPITPSTPMGEGFQAEVARGATNLWDEKLFFLEPESEHSSASACEGFALAGGRVTNFTSGQGLVLMKEVLHVISGKRLPVVFHVGARALTSQALNIHCGHDDAMAVRDCGWGMLFARNAQEVADLSVIARRTAEETSTPFFVVQDGFITTHTLESVLLPEPELLKSFVGSPESRLEKLFDPARPRLSGPVQNQDAYMRGRIAQRAFTDRVPGALKQAFAEYALYTGRRLEPVQCFGMEDAEVAILGLGSMMETALAAAEWMRRERGWRVGVVHLAAFRPFPGRKLVRLLGRCRAVAIVERTDDPLAQANPLALEVQSAFAAAAAGTPGWPEAAWIPRFFCGVAGLGGREVLPGDFVEIAEKLLAGRSGSFAIGIRHPMALERSVDPDVGPASAFRMRGHSIGGLGSVTTNKVIASVAADVFGKHVQAFPKYGSEKKGLPTQYFLTVAEEHVRCHGELSHVDLVAVHGPSAFGQGDPLAGLASGGTLFVSTDRSDEDLWNSIPAAARQRIRELRVRLLALDTQAIARELAPSPELVSRMQGIALLGVFLAATPFHRGRGLSEEELLAAVEKALEKYFGKRGRTVVEANLAAVERGLRGVREVRIPASDAEVPAAPESLAASGGACPGGAFGCVLAAYAGGTEDALEADEEAALSLIPPGSSSRRDFTQLAPEIPLLLPEHCVGCMECVTACPDSAILAKVVVPEVLDYSLADEQDSVRRAALRQDFLATQKFHDLPEKRGERGGLFGLAVDPTKCKGCGECVEVCGHHAALRMERKTPAVLAHAAASVGLLRRLPSTPARFLSEKALADVMLSDAAWLYEGGAGSCMGCGEGTAIRMLLAATGFAHGRENVGLVAATGCNTVFGSTYPYNPFLVPWTNSLFENAATVAMGIRGKWDQLGWQSKRLWVIAGDGAMYDIGFQALSRLLVSGMDVKVLVLDTQVYSNTGGQASGATFVGQEAKMAAFGSASEGKVERRKELGILCAMHPAVYVAQTTTAHVNHFYRAVMEANLYLGPAVVIVYAPCMPEHGIGDDQAAHQCKLAVESRAFPLFVHDPRKGEKLSERIDLRGNPAVRDDWYVNPASGEPVDFVTFARTEGRFRRHFGPEGKPSAALLAGKEDRLRNWRRLQELAGLKG